MGKCYTCKAFCKGLQLSQSVPPLLQWGLVGFWVVCVFQKEVSKSSSGSLFLLFFFLTLQVTLTNHRRISSASLKRRDCRARVMLVDNPYNTIPRWFAFIWKQVHLLGPGFVFSIAGCLPAMEHEGLAKGRRRLLVGNVCRELGRGSHPLKAQHHVRQRQKQSMELLRS